MNAVAHQFGSDELKKKPLLPLEGDMSHWLHELLRVVHAKDYTHKHTGKDVIIYSN